MTRRTVRPAPPELAPTTVYGTVSTVTRAGVSRAGRPWYCITLEGGRAYVTAPDSGCSATAPRYAPGELSAPRVALTLDGRGRAVRIALAD